MPTLNLGILAHIDAGKTTLTERLLFDTGASAHLGRVDHGDTVTDADALERQRGITIRSAVASFRIGDTKVNLIDTPGHADFVAEVERALTVLDGAVLVVSAVEGVQAQTRTLIRILERLGIPFLVFVNKIDRAGATHAEALEGLREALTGEAVAVNEPIGLGTKGCRVSPRTGQVFVEEVVERLAESDDEILQAYLEGRTFTEPEALAALARSTAKGRLHPVCFGAALAGIGITEVIEAVIRYLPVHTGASMAPLHASIFKVESGRHGEKVAYARLHSGMLAARDHVVVQHRSPSGSIEAGERRVSRVQTFDRGARTQDRPAVAGDIAKVLGIGDLEIGDQLGDWDPARSGRQFAPPGLEAVVLARDPGDRGRLFTALTHLAEQDPLIDVRLDGLDQELTVSLYGEVQREVLAARLDEEYGLAVEFQPSQTVFVERVTGTGRAERIIGADGNQELATVGLRIEPGPAGSGIDYRRETEYGALLLSFHTAIEETVPLALRQGLFGWAVTDCVVSLTRSGYWAPTSTAGDFRRLTSTVLREALTRAGTTVCAPVSRFELSVPAAALGAVLRLLHDLGAVPEPPQTAGRRCQIIGELLTEDVSELEHRLPGQSRGEGMVLTEPSGYRPVSGPPPRRPRRQLAR